MPKFQLLNLARKMPDAVGLDSKPVPAETGDVEVNISSVK